ncbi:MAG: hypothetical protein JNL90_12260 [Planctomycetes bacterium]|nr:hypothetical protein [Planctomycetota bacterium]
MTHALSWLASCLLSAAAPAADDPVWLLEVPAEVKIGSSVTADLTGPAHEMGLLMVSGTTGALQSKYGLIEVGFPLMLGLMFDLDANGKFSIGEDVPCDPDLVGVTIYLQFITCAPMKGISNLASITFTDDCGCGKDDDHDHDGDHDGDCDDDHDGHDDDDDCDDDKDGHGHGDGHGDDDDDCDDDKDGHGHGDGHGDDDDDDCDDDKDGHGHGDGHGDDDDDDCDDDKDGHGHGDGHGDDDDDHDDDHDDDDDDCDDDRDGHGGRGGHGGGGWGR